VSGATFDPWAMLATLRGQDQAPADPISSFSRISRGGASYPEIAREPANDPEPLAEPDPIAPLYQPGAPVVPASYWPGVRLAELEAEGATPLLCPFGGQNWQRPDGRETWFSCATMLRLHAAGLVPGSVPDRPPVKAMGPSQPIVYEVGASAEHR